MTDAIREVYNAILPQLITEDMKFYHAKSDKYLSSGKLKDFRDDSPAYFKADLDGKIAPFDSVAYAQGRAAHTLILEGREEYDRIYKVGGPINDTGKFKDKPQPYARSTAKFADWCREQGVDPEFVLTETDHQLNLDMLAGCMRNPLIVKLLSEGVVEKVLRSRCHGVDCQIRPDHFGPVYGWANLKTCGDLNRFERDVRWKFKYTHSDSFYRSVGSSAVPEMARLPVTYIAVEKREPYRAGIFVVSNELLDDAEEQNYEAMDRLIQCKETNEWPTGFEGINHIEKD